MKRVFLFSALTAIVALSFFLYSFNFSPVFNADQAVNVLMTYDFQFPRDLYYWGQDRWGSLIPLIGQFYFHVCHVTPLTAVSLTNYSILIAGYVGISSLFKTNFCRIVFAVLWFLPPFRFMDMLWYVTGVQYSLVAVSVLLINRLDYEGHVGSRLRNHLLLFAVALLWILSMWVSEASSTAIFILVAVLFVFDRKKIRIGKEILFYTVTALVVGAVSIMYAKSHVINKTENYLKFNDVRTILESFSILKTAFADLLLFRVNELFMGIYAWLVILVFIGTGFLLRKNKLELSKEKRKWLLFFLLEGLAVCAVALASKWVFLNGMNRRYFFGAYVSFSVVLLIVIEHLQLNKKLLNGLKSLIVFTVITGAISTVHYLNYVWPKSLKAQVEIYSEFKQLGSFGVISDYWHSYLTASVDPENIKATPNDQEFVRNPDMVNEVFAQPALYLIRDNWMDSFPDTVNQFGHVLIREGEAFTLGGCNVSKYRKLK
jgi:hypothetical protein